MSDIAQAGKHDLWRGLCTLTQARIAIGRSGDAQTTDAVLAFEVAQAQARDAVHQALDTDALQTELRAMQLGSFVVQSQAQDRTTYLRRPDLGRRLSAASRTRVHELEPKQDALVVMIADGLSSAAPARHAVSLIRELLEQADVTINSPVFVATQARVALGDEIGELLHAQAVLVLIGERPGLTTPESLGAYLTWCPRVGRTDAERNCVSNIHANGLSYAAAAHKLSRLLDGARRLGETGVDLHDEADDNLRLK